MSSRRKKYDGDIFGGSFSITERRDSVSSESEIGKHASAKRARKTSRLKNLYSSENIYTDEGNPDRYIITYADLITLLLGLFIILYAVSNVDVNKYKKMVGSFENVFGTQKETITPDIINLKKIDLKEKISIGSLSGNLKSLIVENNISGSVTLEENERGITIHILGDILFPSGDAEFKGDSKLILQKIASVIKQMPNDIRIEGHTDNIPINNDEFPSNWHLSVARALNTAYFLINEENLPPDKISVVGYSEYMPVAENSSSEGRNRNRRVDIVILNK